jgi:hypothetical protein
MSLEILLIPAAMAAYAAWQARAEAGVQNCRIETRWRHPGLLTQALQDLDAANISAVPNSISATINGIATMFGRREDGILIAHFPQNTDIDDALAIVDQVDAAYTRRVQDAVYQRIRTRVTELGYDVHSETVDDDETITLVVNVGSDA